MTSASKSRVTPPASSPRRNWLASGQPWIWLNAAAVSLSVLLLVGLLSLIGARGLAHFWPAMVHELVLQTETGELQTIAGHIRTREDLPLELAGPVSAASEKTPQRWLVKVGNRDLGGQDFRWINASDVVQQEQPYSLTVLERLEWGIFIGRVMGLKLDGQMVSSQDTWNDFQAALKRTSEQRARISRLEREDIGRINYRLERLRLEQRELELDGIVEGEALTAIDQQRAELQAEYQVLEEELLRQYEEIRRESVVMQTAGDEALHDIPLYHITDAWQPNAMSWPQKLAHFFGKLWEFVTQEPREANTEGGIFPAIFGTVLMVLLMTVFVAPLGVVAAIYLREYARQGVLTRTVRIAVNNLAGVPSIVYGVFGLGFFVYALGGSIDQLFYRAALPSPTFGTGGLMWASLTLALLTLPVVIVSTEEGLTRIPRSIREGSLALGATQWETLWRTVIPMASPGIMTGLILAIARAAGEVAPLMLVGVVKLAPSLPLDANAPFLHLDRKFMHLGFHIYDVGFQSPNVEAARPLVYATALLLVVIILLLNIVAIRVRNGLREKFKGLET